MLKTGINSLDKIMGGGFPEKPNILITGPPGNEKEILGFQFLYSGLEEGICFYAFYEQTTAQVEEQFKNYGMDVSDAVKNKKIYWIDASNNSKGDNVINCDLKNLLTISLAFDQFLKTHSKEKIRGVINILSLALMLNEPVIIYKLVIQLVEMFNRYNVSTIFLIETGMHDPKAVAALETLCDIVIEMKSVEKGLEIENLLRIKKMAKIVSKNFYKYEVTEKGIEIKL